MAATSIHHALQDMGLVAQILEDPAGQVLREATGPIFVVGNLSDSRCVRMLYFEALCATDLWYPGPTGYEVRTLCNPFGSGHNVILLGYSDAEGAQAGCEALACRLDDPLPHLKDLRVTRLPMAADEVDECRNNPLPTSIWQIANTMEGDLKGYLYYLTGEPELGEAYRDAWRAIIACGYGKNEKIVQTHLYSLSRYQPWRLVEDMDLFSDEERLAITRFFYGWAQSEEGWQHVANCRRVQTPEFPRQNHELVPALTLMYAAQYFETHFPDVTGPDHWRSIGRQVFEPYGSSWKPLCDGLCHGWWMSQPVMLDYALLDQSHRYFEAGGARQAAECAMAVINNSGWLPTAGDCDLRRQFPGPSLRVAAAYYGDGRFRFAHDLASPDRQLASLTALPRAFDTGLEPQLPDGMIGVTVIPVDPLIYCAWDRDPEVAPLAVTCPPSAPIEICFDKLAIRTGWELTDDYFLMDGLGGGSHSYDDAMGIVEYARLGVSLIVQEDSFVFSAPEHHSVVTIVRDGEAGVIPGFAVVEANETDDAGVIYLRTRLKDYAGADWVREVHLFPGRCVAIVDTVTAKEAGDFAVEAHFRTPTQLKLHGRQATGRRTSPCVDFVDVRIESLCEPTQLSIQEEPVHLRYQKASDKARWCDRYHTDEMILTAFSAREALYLEPGESVRFVHLVQGCAPGEQTIPLAEVAQDLKSFEVRHPVVRAPDPTPRAGGSTPTSLFDAQDRITALCALNDGSIVVGTEGGTMSLVAADGSKLWTAQLDGPVRDIGASQGSTPLLAAGHGSASLTGLDLAGDSLWSTVIEREPCPWPWWEMPTPAPVQVAGGVSDGEPFFAVGCGDIQVRCFDAIGREQWRWRYNEGVPGRVVVTEMDGSGEPRIVVGGDILSDQSTCRILQPDGDLIAELPVEGWTSMQTALAFGEVGGSQLIGCGASRGTNLHLFGLDDSTWERRWMKRLGGRVAGIHIAAGPERVLAATSQGFLLCYDLEGSLVWHRLFEQGIAHLTPMQDGVLVVDAAGGLSWAGLNGLMKEIGALPGPCSFTARAGAAVCLASGSQVFTSP
ncbi:MAG: PQQ-binding-like beta-propeller repeat protein [Gemmatimonadetes bacterium]|nr:PQQ-binding-like beta-propeller repeat protein [Gemmatimonadota bacterium]